MSFELLNKKQRLLPVVCKPYPDEILSSWLTRLAFKHGMNAFTFCRTLFLKYTNIDIDCEISERHLKILSERTDIPLKDIRAMTIQWFEQKLFERMRENDLKENWLLTGKRVNLGTRKVLVESGILFCPGCFQKGRIYFKKEWRMGISFVCISCGCHLLERCPHCHCGSWLFDDTPLKDGQTLDQHLITCHNCGRNVSDCKLNSASESVINMQIELYRIAEMRTWDTNVAAVSYFKVLYQLTDLLFFYRRSMFGIGYFVRRAMPAEPGHNPDALEKVASVSVVPLKWKWKYVVAAYELLNDWPRNCQKILRKCPLDHFDQGVLLRRKPAWFARPIRNTLRQNPLEHTFQRKRISQHTEYIIPVEQQKLPYHYYDHNDNCFYDYIYEHGGRDMIYNIYQLYGVKPRIGLDKT